MLHPRWEPLSSASRLRSQVFSGNGVQAAGPFRPVMRFRTSALMASPFFILQTCSLRVVIVLLPESGETGPFLPPHVFIVRPSSGMAARTVIFMPLCMPSRTTKREIVCALPDSSGMCVHEPDSIPLCSLCRSRVVCVIRAVRPRSSRDCVTPWLVPALYHHLHPDLVKSVR